MELFRNFGWLIIAILVLLALLIAALVVVYDQNGLFLPFAAQPDSEVTTAALCLHDQNSLNNNIIIPNWRILK